MFKTQYNLGSSSTYSFSQHIYQLLTLVGFIVLLLVTNTSFAEKPNPGVAMCPAGTELYGLTDNDYTQLGSTQSPSNPSNTPYLLDNNKVAISINLKEIGTPNSSEPTKLRKEDSYLSVVKYPTGSNSPPSYTDINLNFWQPNTNGTQSLAVRQVGLTVFDLDAGSSWSDLVTVTGVTSSGSTIEGTYYPVSPTFVQKLSIGNSVATNGGFTIYPNTRNCSSNDSRCQASVVFNQAVTSVKVKFGNTEDITSQARSSIRIKLDSYCYTPPPTPPKLTLIKNLDGERIEKKDQFNISIKNSSTLLRSFTTEGKKDEIKGNSGNSGLINLVGNAPYTITERVFEDGKEDKPGEIIGYNATYECTNATTSSSTVMPSGALDYDASNKSRSFTLPNATTNDNITCTITNSTSISYTFLGTVFNDNGGLNLKANEPGTVNNAYFNGIFDRGLESGINDSSVQVRLTNCNGATIATASINAEGSYIFNRPKNSLTVGQTVCLVEDEPNGWNYSVDTTANQRSIEITNGNYSYSNLDFGEVAANNTALVLEKSQYINDCSATLNYSSINDSTSPLTGFSTVTIENIEPGKCIAYKITATNRANISIDDFIMRDVLQKKGVNSAATTSVLANPTLSTADYANDSPAIGQNGTVKTKPLILNPRAKRDFYFNTKYGTSQ